MPSPAFSAWSKAHWAMPGRALPRACAVAGAAASRPSASGTSRVRLGAEGLADDGARGVENLLGLQRAGQVARKFVQGARAPFAVRRDPRLEAQAGGQVPGDQSDREHDREGDQVLQVGHGKVKRGGTKKKSKQATLTQVASTEGPRPKRTATSTTTSRNSMAMLARSR